MPKQIVINLTAAMLMVAAVSAAYAGDKPKPGFSGELFVGGGYSRGDLPLDDAFEDDNTTISSLGQRPTRSSEAAFLIDGRIRYLFSTGTMVGVGAMGGPQLNMEGGYGIRISQFAGDAGQVSLTATHSETEVWQDPFVTGRPRAKTDRETIGISLAWEEVMGTPLGLKYGYEDLDIDKDTAGQRNSSLARDGRIHHLGVSYGLFRNDTHEISANVIGEVGDMDGGAQSFKGGEVDFSYTYSRGRWALETALSWGIRDFDDPHPEFGTRREDTKYGIDTSLTLFAPFGLEDYFVSLFGGYDKRDSNIGFYDKGIWTAGVGVGISF